MKSEPRHTLALRDVGYLIKADIALKPGVARIAAKYRDQFWRRARGGQCYHRPYLGCREFAASFAPPAGNERPIEQDDEIGRMLFDLDFVAGEGRVVRWGHPPYDEAGEAGRFERRGRLIPRFFRAQLERGILRVPPELYASGILA